MGVTAAVAGCLVLSGGTAAPVLIGAAIGAGSGAAISGGITAIGGGSIADVAKSASDGFMWGAVGGAASGGIASLLSNAVKSGSKAAASAAVQKGLDIATDTAMDIAQNVSHGEKITPASVAGSLAFNIITAGNGNGSAKSAGNAIADSTEDGVRREAKDSLSDSVSREAKDSLSDSVSKGGIKSNFDNEIPRSGAEWNEYLKGKYGADNVRWNINSVDDIFSAPTRLKGYIIDELQTTLGNDWTRGVYGSSGGGWKLMNGDISIFYHPGGGKHGGSYYGISSGTTGKIKVVNPETYIPLKGDKASIIYD